MTGGYLSLAATLTSAQIAETISSGGAGCFMHGPTFMGNPLACRVACESIDLLLESPWQENIGSVETKMREGLLPFSGAKNVNDVRVLGAIGVVELEEQPDLRVLQQQFVDKEVWIRPFGRLVYIMPSYNIPGRDLDKLLGVMVETLAGQ